MTQTEILSEETSLEIQQRKELAEAIVNFVLNQKVNELFMIAAKPEFTAEDRAFVDKYALTVFQHARQLAKTEEDELALDELEFSPRRLGNTVFHVAAQSGNLGFIDSIRGFVLNDLDARDSAGQTVEDVAAPGLAHEWISATRHNHHMMWDGLKKMKSAHTPEAALEVSRSYWASLRPVPAIPQ